MDLNTITDKLHKSQCWDFMQNIWNGGLDIEASIYHAERLYKDLQSGETTLESMSHWGLQ